MSEERKMILQMLKDGTVSVEEAERLLDAVPAEAAEPAGGELVARSGSGVMPKRILIMVSENGKTIVNIRLPFSLVRVALKMGVSIGSMSAKHTSDPETAQALEMLKTIDIDESLGSLSDGDISLPYSMIDVDDDNSGDHGKSVLE